MPDADSTESSHHHLILTILALSRKVTILGLHTGPQLTRLDDHRESHVSVGYSGTYQVLLAQCTEYTLPETKIIQPSPREAIPQHSLRTPYT